jgi:hypothetical protein
MSSLLLPQETLKNKYLEGEKREGEGEGERGGDREEN